MATQLRKQVTPFRAPRMLGVAAALVLALALFQQVAHARRDRFEQQDFVIALWGDPPVDDAVNSRYVTIEEAGFNIVLGGVGADSPDKARLQRDAAAATKLKVIFSTYGLPVKKLCNCDATYGFLAKDHPGWADFKKIKARIGEIRLGRPGKLPLINLYAPSTAPAELGAASYADYVGAYVDVIDPEVFCYDYFVRFDPARDSRAEFVENLSAMRRIGIDHARPFWNFIRAMAYDTDAAPSEAQLRWQAWTSMAYGARGLIYFAYWPPPDDAHAVGDGILNAQGEPTPQYGVVKNLNAGLRSFGAVLMEMDSAAVKSGAQLQGSGSGDSIVRIADTDAGDFTAGEFANPHGARASLLINNTLDAEKTLTLAIDAGVQEIDNVSGSAVPVADMDGDRPGIQVRFGPGDARLYVSTAQ